MGEMPPIRQVKPHDSAVRFYKSCVYSKVGWRATISLDIDPPLLRVEVVELQGSLLGEELKLVDVLVAAIVALARLALTVLVVQAGAHALQHRKGCKVLAGNHLQASPLPCFFILDDPFHFWV